MRQGRKVQACSRCCEVNEVTHQATIFELDSRGGNHDWNVSMVHSHPLTDTSAYRESDTGARQTLELCQQVRHRLRSTKQRNSPLQLVMIVCLGEAPPGHSWWSGAKRSVDRCCRSLDSRSQADLQLEEANLTPCAFGPAGSPSE